MLPLDYIMRKIDVLDILRTDKTVFTFKELMLFLGETDIKLLKRRINYYVKTGKFYHIRRGIYAKDENYNKLELATKIYTPAYISLETVLSNAGIVFQHYSQIFVVSYLTRDIVCDAQSYTYKKIKDSVLINDTGIEHKANYAIASKERAFLDTVYLHKDYYFDNLSVLDWDKVFTVLPIYANKTMIKKVNKFYQAFKNSEKL